MSCGHVEGLTSQYTTYFFCIYTLGTNSCSRFTVDQPLPITVYFSADRFSDDENDVEKESNASNWRKKEAVIKGKDNAETSGI